MKSEKILIIILIVTASITSIFGISYLFKMLLGSSCSNEYTNKIFSSDDKYYSQILTHNCGGATGEISTYVKLNYAQANEESKGEAVLAIKGFSTFKTSWIDKRTLKVTYTNCSDVDERKSAWKDVKIVYEEQCTGNN